MLGLPRDLATSLSVPVLLRRMAARVEIDRLRLEWEQVDKLPAQDVPLPFVFRQQSDQQLPRRLPGEDSLRRKHLGEAPVVLRQHRYAKTRPDPQQGSKARIVAKAQGGRHGDGPMCQAKLRLPRVGNK